MKTIHIFIALALSMIIASCQKELDDYETPSEKSERIINENRALSDYNIKLIYKDDYIDRTIRFMGWFEYPTSELFSDSNIVVINVADFIENIYGKQYFLKNQHSSFKVEQLKPVEYITDEETGMNFVRYDVELCKYLTSEDSKFVIREY